MLMRARGRSYPTTDPNAVAETDPSIAVVVSYILPVVLVFDCVSLLC
jgi:hypothetical protein